MSRPAKVISEFDVCLGKVVKSKRAKVGYSRLALADRTGIPEANLKRREAGINEITVSELERIAKVVRVAASVMAKEALDDYGGIDKLLREFGPPDEPPVSGGRPNLKPLPPHGAVEGDEEDELLGDGEEYPSAANFDPEHDQDEPAHP